MRTIECSSSKRNSASARASSVLPTPVGPRKINEPIGRLGSLSPARERRIALATRSSASSWPTTRCRRRSSMVTSFLTSPSSIFETGMPVHLETMRATSSSSTSSFSMRLRRGAFHLRRQFLELFFRLRQQAISNLCHALQVALALFGLLFDLELLDLFLERRGLRRSDPFPASSWLSERWIFPATRPVLSRLPPAALCEFASFSFFSACFSISSCVARRSS